MPGRPREVREKARHPARHALARARRASRRWVLDGEPEWVSWRKSWPGNWYGVERFFAWLETKAYKMHIRVLLSKYRAYTPCAACGGARLKPDALLWRLGTKEDADRVLAPAQRFRPHGVAIGDRQLAHAARAHDARSRAAADRPHARVLRAPHAARRRSTKRPTCCSPRSARAFAYLAEVGLGYLTLDRQSRTLSGGEVQRINLTTALGTSLVNTLFVLDEPSIGLHPRDMGRVIGVMQRLRDAGNSLVVVEHDPQIMLAADRILDMGPGPGERGGEIVFFGTPEELVRSGRVAHRRLSLRPASAPRARRRRRPAANGAAHRAPRRRRAQPEEHRRRDPAQRARLRHRRVRLRQVDAGAGRAARRAAARQGQADGSAGRASRARRAPT